jgi:hypothetical protein
MFYRVGRFLLNHQTILVVYIIIAIAASVQLISTGKHTTRISVAPNSKDIILNRQTIKLFEGKRYTDYNNYIVFKNSFFHLIKGKDLYTIYPEEQWDLYKYSPAFALFIGTIAWLPDFPGLTIWNLLNALTLLFAINMLPVNNKTRSLISWFVLIELLTCMQNAQSNGLIAGLMIAAYANMYNGRIRIATLLILLAAFIKPYAAIGCCLFLFYPGKFKFIIYSMFWCIILLCIPLLVTPLSALLAQYKSWFVQMGADQSASYGLSVMGWLHSWFGLDSIKTYVMLFGLVLFIIPLFRWSLYRNNVYRMCILASMLVWVIIFNHKAESPTFIIAVTGAAIWYFSTEHTPWRTALLWLVFIGTCLSPTDIFPPSIKQHFFKPYVIKAIPCIIIWIAMTMDLLTMKNDNINKAGYALK